MDKIPAADCTYLSSGSNPLFTHGAPVLTDQAGNLRDATCDIGAYEVPPVGIQVLSAGLDIPNRTGAVDFGTTVVGKPVTKTFTIRNVGKSAALSLSNLAVPAGFSVASPFGSTTVMTNSQTTFAIRLDATQALDYQSLVSFTNNVANRTPFNFTVLGSVRSSLPYYLSIIHKH